MNDRRDCTFNKRGDGIFVGGVCAESNPSLLAGELFQLID